jgi:uncharacterized membrane protein
MIKLIFLVIFYVGFPFVIILMCKKWSFMKRLGSIVLAYAFGLLLGNIGILPTGSDDYKLALQGRAAMSGTEVEQLISQGSAKPDDLYVNTIASLQDMVLSLIVPLAIPLLLFSLNIKRWLRFAGKGFVSMLLAFVSVVIIIFTGFLIFRNTVPDAWKISGMLVGVYTGGTPNLAAIKTALDVDPSLFIMTHTYDMIVGAITIIFFITIGSQVFGLVLPKFRKETGDEEINGVLEEVEDLDDFSGMLSRGIFPKLMLALGFSLIIFAVSAGLSFLIPSVPQMVIVILAITTLGIAASLINWVNRIPKTFQLGMFLILVFSLVVASMADLSIIFSIKYINLFLLITYSYFGSMLLHLLLSVIFKVDTDNYLITTTALIYSPPFVPVVAAALKNKDVIITGLTVGIIGYVIGNYLGVAMGFFLKGF